MKSYSYHSLSQGCLRVLDEEAILAEYWDGWVAGMRRAWGHEKDDELTRQNCINDWIIDNCAREVK